MTQFSGGNLGRAVLQLVTDDSQWIPGLDKAGKRVGVLDKEVGKVGASTGKLEGSLGMANKALGAFGITLGAAAVVGFAKSILADADALAKLHDKTSISTNGLQILQIAGDEAGNSIEELTNAISFMQRSLGGKDAPFLQALRELGINVEQLQRLAPEEQFFLIADALKAVQDPAKQVDLAVATLGRTGANVLPTIKRGFDDLKDSAVGMSSEAVFALDAIGDTFAATWRGVKAGAADWAVGIFRPWVQHWQQVTEAAKLYEEQLEFIKRTANDPAMQPGKAKPFMIGIPSEADQKRLADAAKKHLSDLERAAEKAAEQEREKAARQAAADLVKRAADERAFWNFVGERQMEDAAAQMAFHAWYEGALKKELAILESTFDITKEIGFVWEDIALLTEAGSGGWLTGMDLEPVFEQTKNWADALHEVAGAMSLIGDRWSALAQGMIKQIESIVAIWKTGNKGAAVGAAIGVGGQFIPTGTKAGKVGFGAAQGASTGAMLGSVIPGLGTLVGGAIGGGIGALVGWFQSQKAAKQVNDLRDAFVRAAGGLGELDKRAHQAGVTLTRILDAKTPQEYQDAIEELNDALEFQDQSWERLMEAVDKYGLQIDQLGPALSQQMLDKQAEELLTDFRLLEGAGVDVENVSVAMKDAINAYFQDAKKAGRTIPLEMKEILKQLVTMGLLYDENGEKVEDLEESGVTFAETLDEKFGTLIDTINDMIDAIGRFLGITKEAGDEVNNLPAPPSTPDRPTLPDIPDVLGMAAGGLGRVTRPTLFLAGEGGPEDFAFSGGGKRFGGTGAGTTVVFELDRRVMAEWLLPELPGAITRLGLGR